MANQNKIYIPDDPEVAQIYSDLEKEKLKSERGFLGKFFGSSVNSPTNILGLTVLLLFIAGGIYSTFNPSSSFDLWKLFTPLLGTILGFLFGKNKS